MLDLTSIINTQAIPVFLIPLNGLLCAAFYTRLTNVGARLHAIQKHIIDLQAQVSPKKKQNDDLERAKNHFALLHKRSILILFTLACLLFSLIIFCVCAVLITLTIRDPKFFDMALTAWFLGPLMIVIGLLNAGYELLLSFKSIKLYDPLETGSQNSNHDAL